MTRQQAQYRCTTFNGDIAAMFNTRYPELAAHVATVADADLAKEQRRLLRAADGAFDPGFGVSVSAVR
jgi:hypothetical protein